MILKTELSSLSALAKANLVKFLIHFFEKMYQPMGSTKWFCLLLNLQAKAAAVMLKL